MEAHVNYDCEEKLQPHWTRAPSNYCWEIETSHGFFSKEIKTFTGGTPRPVDGFIFSIQPQNWINGWLPFIYGSGGDKPTRMGSLVGTIGS